MRLLFFRYVISYTAYNSEGKLYVPWMKQQCEAKGAKFVTREVKSVKEVGHFRAKKTNFKKLGTVLNVPFF